MAELRETIAKALARRRGFGDDDKGIGARDVIDRPDGVTEIKTYDRLPVWHMFLDDADAVIEVLGAC